MATSVEPEGLSQSCDAMLTFGDEEWEGETGQGYGHVEMTALHHFVTEHGVNQAIVVLKSGADKIVTCESRPVCLKCGAVLRYLKFTCNAHTQWGRKRQAARSGACRKTSSCSSRRSDSRTTVVRGAARGAEKGRYGNPRDGPNVSYRLTWQFEMNNEVQQVSAIRRAGRLAWRMAAKGKRMLFPRKDYVVHEGSLLPPPELRFNGPDYRNDEFFLASSIKEAKRVITKFGYTPRDFLVDIGCGQGRLPIGLVRHFGNARYLGLDVSEASVQWCKRHIEKRYPSYRFQHVDVVNARYNPSGQPLSVDFRLPVADGTADVVYMWGVVTNMEPEHLIAYASEISRMLLSDGKVFLTANLEDNVPQVSINPENYTAFACQGPLHIVRYERQYFMDVFQRAGLALTEIAYHFAGNCQSELYFVKQ